MYVSDKRVVRDGYLVAFEGETMTEDEARGRGLLGTQQAKPAAKRSVKKPAPKKAAGKA